MKRREKEHKMTIVNSTTPYTLQEITNKNPEMYTDLYED